MEVGERDGFERNGHNGRWVFPKRCAAKNGATQNTSGEIQDLWRPHGGEF